MINSESIIALIEQIIKSQTTGRVILITENARYYRSKAVRKFLEKHPRVRFEFLPPYCPNLNLIERLWGFLRKKVTHNRHYDKFALFEESLIDFLENIDDWRSELTTLMSEKFQIIRPDDYVVIS